jgi:hypothetical protein
MDSNTESKFPTLDYCVEHRYLAGTTRANHALEAGSSSTVRPGGLHVTFDPRAKSPMAQTSKSSPILEGEGDTEKVLPPLTNLKELILTNWQFPAFTPNPKAIQKSRSLTQAEINMGVITEDQVAALGERLQTDPPPMSLQEARERRASIKEERKRSIEFIRSRTNSRAAANGRPSMDGFNESGTAASGHPSLEVLKEAQHKE